MLMSKKDWEFGQELYRQASGLENLNLFEGKVAFEVLENGKYACINKNYRIVTFPQNFVPLEGSEYDCEIQQTYTGIFVYKGISYRVRRAYIKMSYEEYVNIHKCSSSNQKKATLGDLLRLAQKSKR